MERIKNMPVPVIPTFVGALTLANVYGGLNFAWVRHITMWVATIVLLCYLVKIVTAFDKCKAEYSNVVPCSLYAALFMMTMILGSYYNEFIPGVGKIILLIAVACHATHICIFTFRNVISKRDINTFVPSWYVTYNGIMVSCVAGAGFLPKVVLNAVTYYGIVIYLVILPFMLYRLFTVEVKAPVYHTMAVLLAPCSLCVVSYINVVENKNATLLYFLYVCVLCSLAFIIFKLPKFFAFNWVPGYAGVTFPMAIGCVATGKMAGFLTNAGNEKLAGYLTQLQGIQIYLTTMIIGWVLLQFLIMLLRVERR
ncbi:MAG: TDT family transporter [Eubacteriales bacterium]|nr:TDT family transporter [Eubacteriales bacterium]